MSELENGIISIKWILIGWLFHLKIFQSLQFFMRASVLVTNYCNLAIGLYWNLVLKYDMFQARWDSILGTLKGPSRDLATWDCILD